MDDRNNANFAADAVRELLFSTRGEEKYEKVLQKAQAHISSKLPKKIEEVKESELKSIIEQYVTDFNIKCEITDTASELVNYLYHDMAGWSFITRCDIFNIQGFEELNINSWNDVDICINGVKTKTDYSFLSPQHAVDIIRRMLRKTGTIIDDAMPRAIADIADGVRICVEKHPIVDTDTAVCASIRKVSLNNVSEDFITENQTATEKMLNFLLLCLRHGVSMCISGETGAGKTTFAGGLLSIISQTHRVITIEEGSREWDFIKRDKSGKALNSVVHLKTRPSDEPKLNIDQEFLVKDSLRLDPDVIAPGEVRGREAFEVMGVSNTGHTVITTIHSNGAENTPERFVSLAKKAFDMSDDSLFKMMASAFPILVHAEMLADNSRKITQIYEVLGFKNGEMKYNPVFEYEITDNIYGDDDSITVVGNFVQKNSISDALRKTLLKKGARASDIAEFYDREGGEKRNAND